MRRTLPIALAPLVLLLHSSKAKAEEPKLDYADGVSECQALVTRNEKELADWEKLQPSTKYKHPVPDLVLNAPWGDFLHELGQVPDLVLATILPQVGAQYRLGDPAVFVSWPWQIPFGPGFTCSRKQGDWVVDKHKPNRFLIEPGFVSSRNGAGPHVRLGYRFLYQPSDWVVGAGLGIGSTIEIFGNKEPFRVSAGGEAVIRFGHCCQPDYFTLVFRYDHYFAGNAKDIIGGALGFTYF